MKELKQRAIDKLRNQMPQQQAQLLMLDKRLYEYYKDLCEHSSIDEDDPQDWHNLHELLAALKELRLLRTYPVNYDKVHQVIRLREGVWQQQDGIWRHEHGGLLQPGSRGDTYYRWMPFQVFVLTAMYGSQAWIDTEVPNGSRELLPTEREGDNGTIEDLRRLCTDFTFFAPRKTDKTGLSAYNNFLYFMLEDEDAEIYCCANSQTQSRLLFNRTSGLIRQMDPTLSRIRFTASQVNWKPGQLRKAQLWALSAGGKAKDGLFAQLCCADEFGSAGYVNDKSDMGALVNVVLSSMGPRREPMMFTSTTAGTITAGPFIDKLANMKRELQKELDMPDDVPHDGRLHNANDRWMILPLCPDEWQTSDEYLLTSKAVRHKVNPALGVIVQNSFYEQSVEDSRLDPMKKIETVTKLFNVYQTGRVKSWIKSDRIRPLQRQQRIEDCRFDQGWQVFVGLDFSHGDDLFAITYLGVDYKPGPSMTGRFFADMDAWILEETLKRSPNRPLYEQWIQQGWLHVCPGEVFDSTYAINALVDRMYEHDPATGQPDLQRPRLNFYSFGYDPAQNRQPINLLKAWLQTILQRQDMDPAQIPKVIERMVLPVSQTAMTMNPIIGHLEDMIKDREAWLMFSDNPMWPWQFGNCAAEVSTSNLRRIVKGGPRPSHKIDNVMALMDALWCFDLSDGKVGQ